MNLITGFKQFLMRGNVIDLAVAFVVGLAFLDVVSSFVSNLLTPIIGVIFGEPSFGSLSFTINDSHFFYGNFINQVITFVSIAAAVYFLVVVPRDLAMRRNEPPADPLLKKCPECLSEIPAEARRCAHCTAQLT